MKKMLTGLLAVCLLIGAITVPAAAATNREDDVELVLEMVSRASGSEYAWNADGGRESRSIAPNPTEERVWGWSTCFDKYGDEARHYTHSRFETLLGTSQDQWSSGRVWGSGEVWAYSPYINYTTAGEMKARVYYGR